MAPSTKSGNKAICRMSATTARAIAARIFIPDGIVMLLNSTAMLEPDAPAIHYRSFSGVGPARSALRDQRTRGYRHGTDAARGDVDHHDSERALQLFALNALIEGEALRHSTFISEGLQMQSDGESGDLG